MANQTNPTKTVDETLTMLLDSFHAGCTYPDSADLSEIGQDAWPNRDKNASYHQIPVQGDGYHENAERSSIVVTSLFGRPALSEHQWIPDRWDRTREYPNLVCFRLFDSIEEAEAMLEEIVPAVQAVAKADAEERDGTGPHDERRAELAAKYG